MERMTDNHRGGNHAYAQLYLTDVAGPESAAAALDECRRRRHRLGGLGTIDSLAGATS